MSFSEQQIAALTAKLDPKNVKKPSGQFGPKGDYIEGWHAIAEANRIFGFDAWSYRIVDMNECHPPMQNEKGNHAVAFIARVEVTVSGVSREDVGYGSGFAKQLGDAYESATKEAVTDALKRALKSFGNPFGLALYDKSQANVGVHSAPKETPKRASSAEQKRGLADIDNDLLDCETIADVDKLAKTWSAIFKRDEWSRDFIDEAAKKFEPRRQQIRQREADEIADGETGSGIRDATGRELSYAEA